MSKSYNNNNFCTDTCLSWADLGVAFAVAMLSVWPGGPQERIWEPILQWMAGDAELHTHVPENDMNIFIAVSPN